MWDREDREEINASPIGLSYFSLDGDIVTIPDHSENLKGVIFREMIIS